MAQTQPKKPLKVKSEAQQREDFAKTLNAKKGFSFEAIRSHRQILKASGYDVSTDPSEEI